VPELSCFGPLVFLALPKGAYVAVALTEDIVSVDNKRYHAECNDITT
jgi:hypothetical protein